MKKSIALTLAVVLLLSLTSCGGNTVEPETTVAPTETTVPETTQPFDLDSYKSMMATCINRMHKNSTLLSILALYEQSYWDSLEKVNGIVTAEKLFSKACEYLVENTDYDKTDVVSWHETILTHYKNIISTEISGAEAESIKEVFDEYFDAYLSLYSLAMEPSGELEDFIDSYESYSSIIENCETKLEVLLS